MSRMDGKKTHTQGLKKNIYIYIYQTRSSLESRCTVNKRGIRAQDRNTKYDPKGLKFIVIITIKGVYNM